MDERRKEPRLLCSDLIEVRVEGAEPADFTANLEDISPSGACLQSEQPIACGAHISLQLGRHRFTGEVRYCVHNEIGYFAGVQFGEGQKWSRQIYTPKHLLDPASLLKRKR
jgi:PilZ domain-containing protein